MNEWLIIPRNEKAPDGYTVKIDTGKYFFYSNFLKDSYYYNENQKCGIFIDGYIIPVLNHANLKNDARSIYRYFEKEKLDFINNFKGIFTIIIIYQSELFIITDQFGLSKFFYSMKDDHFYASNQIVNIKKYLNTNISVLNILEYLLLNYFIAGKTIYDSIHYSLGGLCYQIGKFIDQKRYFNIKILLNKSELTASKIITVDKGAEIWKNLINQYVDKFQDYKISMALTAGLDSRMILAAFRHLKMSPVTFTFGAKESVDVDVAMLISERLKLVHHHYYPDRYFFENYLNLAKDTILSGSTLVSSYRTHRYDAYKKHKKYSNLIFWGFAGSEVIRGLYPDGLIVSDFIKYIWLNGIESIEDYINQFFKRLNIEIDQAIRSQLIENIRKYDFLISPREYLFQVIIPCHFGQDIKLLHTLDMKSVCPYWDIDFLVFLNETGYLISDLRKKDFAKIGHFRRRMQPFLSSKIIRSFDSECSEITVGKGYSPKDYTIASWYSGLKFLIFKIYRSLNKRYIANFAYDEWYFNFLSEYYTKNKFDFLKMNKDKIINQLSNQNVNDEYGYLTFTKLVNLDISIKQ